MSGKPNKQQKNRELGDLKRKQVDPARQDQVRGGLVRRSGGDEDDDLDELEVQR